MKIETLTAEHVTVSEQLSDICKALPWCHGLNWRFSDLKEDALSDLYAALEGLCVRFCELLGLPRIQATKRPLGQALAKYLYDHPDRCEETLNALVQTRPVVERRNTSHGHHSGMGR